MKEYFKNNILSSKDYEQALSFTFGTFYIPFLNETKYEYLQAVYNMINVKIQTLFSVRECPS